MCLQAVCGARSGESAVALLGCLLQGAKTKGLWQRATSVGWLLHEAQVRDTAHTTIALLRCVEVEVEVEVETECGGGLKKWKMSRIYTRQGLE